jgi:hypothetical protein
MVGKPEPNFYPEPEQHKNDAAHKHALEGLKYRKTPFFL